MGTMRDWLSHSPESLRKLGEFLLPPPPTEGEAAPPFDRRVYERLYLALSLLAALSSGLSVGDETGGKRVLSAVTLVLALALAVLITVGMARRHWRRQAAPDHNGKKAKEKTRNRTLA